MRPRHAILAVLIAILLGIITRSRLVSQKEEITNPEPEIQSTQSTGIATPTQTPSAVVASPTAVVDAKKGSTGKLDFPTLREVREQVAQDPHHTPPALIQFAKELSAHAENAKQSPASAQEFFGTLEDCLAQGKDPSETVPVPAQLACLTTAEEFAKLYPKELGSRLKPLQQNSSPELKRIRQALDRF
ncbi:MAG: hypothetical protein ACJ763_11090 [Bdellovibrionia bacterium]